MAKCAQCGRDVPWYTLFPRKKDKRDICTVCGTTPIRSPKEIRLSPKKQLTQADVDLQVLADEMDGGA
jgi:hypothetical protein